MCHASLYEAHPRTEASLMAGSCESEIEIAALLIPRTVNSSYRRVAVATAGNQGPCEFEDISVQS